MSARRQARGRNTAAAVVGAGGIPRVFLIGRCIEVWGDPAARMPIHSAMRRFGTARRWWLGQAGIEDRDSWRLVPEGAPWSIVYLIYRGQAERIGRPIDDIVAERFAAVGCTSGQIPQLRREADALFGSALLGDGAVRPAHSHNPKTEN